MYAVEGYDYKQMTIAEVIEAVEVHRNKSGVKRVTLTGGEPLLHAGIDELLQALCNKGFEINIETNGTIPCKLQHANLFYTMDWKCKSSGMSDKMRIENLATLDHSDVLKFVVGSTEDLYETENVVTRLFAIKEQNADKMPHIFVSPVFGTLEYETIVEWMLSSRMMTENNARFQVQLHKVVWDPDKRGV